MKWVELYLMEDDYADNSSSVNKEQMAIDFAKTLGIMVQNNPSLKQQFASKKTDEEKKKWIISQISANPDLAGISINDDMYNTIMQSGAFSNDSNDKDLTPQQQPKIQNPMDRVNDMALDNIEREKK